MKTGDWGPYDAPVAHQDQHSERTIASQSVVRKSSSALFILLFWSGLSGSRFSCSALSGAGGGM